MPTANVPYASRAFTAIVASMLVVLSEPALAAAPDRPGIGPVGLGDGRDAVAHLAEVRFLGATGSVHAARGRDGRIEQIAFLPDPRALQQDAALAAPEREAFDVLRERLRQREGRPGAEVGPRHLAWTAADGASVTELQEVQTSGGVSELRVIVRTADPMRICGEGDGFDAFHQRFREAVHEGDADGILSSFVYPFHDAAWVVHGRAPEERMHFGDAAELRERLHEVEVQNFLSDLANAAADCDPFGYEGHPGGVLVPFGLGAVQALPAEDGWRFVVRDYLP